MRLEETSWESLPTNQFIALLLFCFGGYVAIGPILGIIIVYPIYGYDFGSNLVENKNAVFILQAASQVVGFIIAPLIYLKYVGNAFLQESLKKHTGVLHLGGITVTAVILFTFVNAPIIEWNANVQFPEWLAGFAKWARELEDRTNAAIEALIQMDSFSDFFVALIVMAVIPGIAEEIFFRGILQNQIQAKTRSTHLAIWGAAVVFSAIHFQFFGFVPRMLLGAFFGYLYLWSGTLWLPVIAHFTNNGFMLLAAYLDQMGLITLENDNIPGSTSIPAFLLALILFLILMIYFRHASIQLRK